MIDVFVDELDLGALGFGGVDPMSTGWPSYHPSALLKLYVYGYLNRVHVQVAVDTKHHLIVTHEVTNVGNDRSQLASVAKQSKDTLETENLDVVADRGYFNSTEILACEEAGVRPVTLPKPMTSGAKIRRSNSASRFFATWLRRMCTYVLPVKGSPTISRTRNTGWFCIATRPAACQSCPIKPSCTTSKEQLMPTQLGA